MSEPKMQKKIANIIIKEPYLSKNCLQSILDGRNDDVSIRFSDLHKLQIMTSSNDHKWSMRDTCVYLLPKLIQFDGAKPDVNIVPLSDPETKAKRVVLDLR